MITIEYNWEEDFEVDVSLVVRHRLVDNTKGWSFFPYATVEQLTEGGAKEKNEGLHFHCQVHDMRANSDEGYSSENGFLADYWNCDSLKDAKEYCEHIMFGTPTPKSFLVGQVESKMDGGN